jgi:hypothetical protein
MRTKVDALYFETTMISTVGFGDIVPASQATRAVVTLNILMNLIFVGVTLRLMTWAVQRARGVGPAGPVVPRAPTEGRE